MAKVIRTEKRKRGIFGTLIWWAFLAFNGFMGLWTYMAIRGVSDHMQTTTEAAERAGAAIGGTLATGFILSLWLTGSLILGLIVALTRGKTVTIEEVVE